MFVTIIYYFDIVVDKEDYQLMPYSQYDLIDTVIKPGYNFAGDYQNINYYRIEFDGIEIDVPETHAVLEAKKREGKDTRTDYIYDKYTGELSQPKDWVKDFIERTGNDITQNMRARHNGEDVQIPQKGGSKAIDKDEPENSGDTVFDS